MVRFIERFTVGLTTRSKVHRSLDAAASGQWLGQGMMSDNPKLSQAIFRQKETPESVVIGGLLVEAEAKRQLGGRASAESVTFTVSLTCTSNASMRDASSRYCLRQNNSAPSSSASSIASGSVE